LTMRRVSEIDISYYNIAPHPKLFPIFFAM